MSRTDFSYTEVAIASLSLVFGYCLYFPVVVFPKIHLLVV